MEVLWTAVSSGRGLDGSPVKFRKPPPRKGQIASAAAREDGARREQSEAGRFETPLHP